MSVVSGGAQTRGSAGAFEGHGRGRARDALRLAGLGEELERVRLQLKESEDMVESQGHQLASRQARIEQLESQLGDELVRACCAHTTS